MNLELLQAQRIYKFDGPQHLAEYLAETDEALQGKRYLTDAKGRDLVSGVDRSDMLSPEGSPRNKVKNGQMIIVKSSTDGGYRLVVVAPPPLGLVRFLPYYVLVGLSIMLLGWAFSVGIVSPLRRVAETVDRFGRGDLSARVESDRKDEIGNLARSFNSMAERESERC